jgi:hypothetical protein
VLNNAVEDIKINLTYRHKEVTMPSHVELLRQRVSLSFTDFLDNMSKDDLSSPSPDRQSLNLLNYIGSKFGDPFLHDLVTIMDCKHLYGKRIYKLFVTTCGKDVDRFIYHIKMELPCQICGSFVLAMMEPMDDPKSIDVYAHKMARQFAQGKSNSFWGLEPHPEDPNYSYPIVGPII